MKKKTNKRSLIIFDFDGVLADSKKAYAFQMQETIKKISGKDIGLKHFEERMGNNDQMEDFCYFLETTEKTIINQAVKLYKKLTRKYIHLRTLYPNTSTVLAEIKPFSYMGVVSRKSQKRLEYWLEHFDIAKYIDLAIGTLAETKAPSIEKIRKNFGTNPSRTLMIGDTEFDIKSAKEAGVKSAIAVYGTSMLERVLKLQPDYQIHETEEIIELAMKISNSIVDFQN